MLTLTDLPWEDWWDTTKPTIWQINYARQLMLQTGIELEIEEDREAYKHAIGYLVSQRQLGRMLPG